LYRLKAKQVMKYLHSFSLGFLPLTLIFPGVAMTKDYEPRIELVGCQPDGIINSWRARLDPKDFWIKQHVVFEIAMEEKWRFEDAISDCGSLEDKKERTECVLYHRNRFAAIVKCERHTRMLCRQYGGRC